VSRSLCQLTLSCSSRYRFTHTPVVRDAVFVKVVPLDLGEIIAEFDSGLPGWAGRGNLSIAKWRARCVPWFPGGGPVGLEPVGAGRAIKGCRHDSSL
jgi:hypothetical protein